LDGFKILIFSFIKKGIMKEVTVEISYTIELKYDENSPAFQKAFEAYKAAIDNEADVDDMIKQVAAQVQANGFRRMIEGVGYVRWNQLCTDETLYCGIEVIEDDPLSDVEIIEEF
jgi:hypothetical protein